MFQKVSGIEKVYGHEGEEGGTEHHYFPSKLCLSTERFPTENLQCFRNIRLSKILCIRRVCHGFLSKICCLTVPKKNLEEPFCVPQSLWYRNISCIREVMTNFTSKSFCLAGPENLLCSRKVSLSKKFMGQRGERGEGGSITIHCREFVSQYRKTFDVSEILGYWKIQCTWGDCHGLLSNVFSLTVPKTFFGEPFCVSERFWYPKTLPKRGGGERDSPSLVSFESLLSHSAWRHLRGKNRCFKKFRLWKNFTHKRDLPNFSVKNLLSQSPEKPSLLQIVSSIEKFHG